MSETGASTHQEPWYHRPDEQMAQDHATHDGKVFREESIEITADRNRVAGDICDDRSETLDECAKKDQSPGAYQVSTSAQTPPLLNHQAYLDPRIRRGQGRRSPTGSNWQLLNRERKQVSTQQNFGSYSDCRPTEVFRASSSSKQTDENHQWLADEQTGG
jgi:hypothetical protein